jgi:hypothetical protein
LKLKGLNNTTLIDYTTIIMPEAIIEHDRSSSADYSTDIHRHLNLLQKTLIETIGRPISEQILDKEEIVRSRQNEF